MCPRSHRKRCPTVRRRKPPLVLLIHLAHPLSAHQLRRTLEGGEGVHSRGKSTPDSIVLNSCYPCPTLERKEILHVRTSGLADNPDIILVCAKWRRSGEKAVQEVHFTTITDDIAEVDGALACSEVTIRSRKCSCMRNRLRKWLFQGVYMPCCARKGPILYSIQTRNVLPQLTTGREVKLVANDTGVFCTPQSSTNRSPLAADAQFHSTLQFCAATNKTDVTRAAGSIGRS